MASDSTSCLKSVIWFAGEIVILLLLSHCVLESGGIISSIARPIHDHYCSSEGDYGDPDTCRPRRFGGFDGPWLKTISKEQLYYLYRTKDVTWWSISEPLGHLPPPETVEECLKNKIYYCSENPHATKMSFCECYVDHSRASSIGYDCSFGIPEERGKLLNSSIFDGSYISRARSCTQDDSQCDNWILNLLSC
jgi:hypothetical protein